MYRSLILLHHILLFISIFSLQSDATSFIHIFRQLAADSGLLAKPQIPLQISPSPSPLAAIPATASVNLPNMEMEPVVKETCEKMSKKCYRNSITACLGVEGSLLHVLNDDDSSLRVDITILPLNITYEEIDIPRHQSKKINISDNIRGSSSIVLDAGNGLCIIHMGAVVPKDNINLQFPSFDTYITPVNGAYVLFASALIIGGTWACFKMWKGRRHLDGVPYQELEMGQSDLVTSVNVETAEGWDQDWDDDWDEEKGVKSAAGNSVKSGTANGNTLKSSKSDGWGNDWDD